MSEVTQKISCADTGEQAYASASQLCSAIYAGTEGAVCPTCLGRGVALAGMVYGFFMSLDEDGDGKTSNKLRERMHELVDDAIKVAEGQHLEFLQERAKEEGVN